MTDGLYSVGTKPACYGCIRTLLHQNNGTQLFIKELPEKKVPRELMIAAVAEFTRSMSIVLLLSKMSKPVSLEAYHVAHKNILSLWQIANPSSDKEQSSVD